jgi:predicted regulator of Ras-like GTPase activity (Roadblock/LC7/MglB family)
VTAGGADEVGELADAFTQVHRAAVGLAVEQAQMRRNVGEIFVHLARRSQVLVERQLEVLDALEQHEQNPNRLADLFKIDHLATRQRRTNDSLLVLAGVDTLRSYQQPLPLASIIQAAIAEIEQYQRIHDRVEEISVVGHAVMDLVHLLAELLDNATAFSEPHTTVDVYGHPGPGGTGATVTITDFGTGMSPAAFRETNRLLADPPPIDVAASERMGLVVVGHLAARHQTRVRLEPAAPGVRATVWLPASLLTTTTQRPGTPGAEPDGPRPAHPPVRAEDVLGQARGTPPANAWWARPGEQPAIPTPAGTRTPQLPAPPGAGRTTPAGLPVRVPLAQVPGGHPTKPPSQPKRPVEQDPDQAGGALSALYQGCCGPKPNSPTTTHPHRCSRAYRKDHDPMTTLSQPARDLQWLINNFNEKVAGVSHAIVVSSDGLLLVASRFLPTDHNDKLAAIVSGLASMTAGVADIFGEPGVLQTMVEMPSGFLLVRSISDGSILATLAAKTADLGTIGYEMAKLAKQSGELLTPELRRELRPTGIDAGTTPP